MLYSGVSSGIWHLFGWISFQMLHFFIHLILYGKTNQRANKNEGPMLCPPHREPLHSKREREWDRDSVLKCAQPGVGCSPSSASGVSSKNYHLPEVEQFRSVYPAKVLNNKCWWSKKGCASLVVFIQSVFYCVLLHCYSITLHCSYPRCRRMAAVKIWLLHFEPLQPARVVQ